MGGRDGTFGTYAPDSLDDMRSFKKSRKVLQVDGRNHGAIESDRTLRLTAVKDTAVAALDARFLQTTAESAVQLARKMQIDGMTFDIDDFLIR